mmetsp:Transcript_8127/g.15299  ORF Transcript_8127/g.15299 Transcript_8127/m.15299 type:complete len:494 (+) Transcript_8127:390-1871(+)
MKFGIASVITTLLLFYASSTAIMASEMSVPIFHTKEETQQQQQQEQNDDDDKEQKDDSLIQECGNAARTNNTTYRECTVSDVDTTSSSCSTTTTTTTTTSSFSSPSSLSIPFPVMPDKIRAIIQQNHNVLDPQGTQMLSQLQAIEATTAFAHARSTFYEHLEGTFSILSAWNQPTDIKRAGMVHTAYSGDLFQFFLFDSNQENERQKLRNIIDTEAEALVYLFGTIHRGILCDFKNVVNRITEHASCSSDNTTVAHRGLGTVQVTPRQAANILMVTIADYLDQMVDTNGWRDHHQHDLAGENLYPGNGRPALGFYWFSSVCQAIRNDLEVIPDIFDSCTSTISYEHEEEARDAYWKVTMEEANLELETQIQLLQKTISLNPYVAEPHSLLSQIYYRQGRYLQSATEAKTCLEKFYTLASNWDKRRSYAHWVGYARMMLLRSNRQLEMEEYSIPIMMDGEDPVLYYTNYEQLKLTNLNSLLEEMTAREETVQYN